ncbi:hypothetical protein ABZX75_17475 [Streptomyces sp. NPDC003038]|uniref:hypothetical protein n=1 Tax=unclassified Streptomyces TaxID=2593676 RepID=UPI0033B617D8
MATILTPTFTTTVPASELEAGMLVWLDGARRWVFEAAIDGETMRLRIEGFNTPFTVPVTWTYTVHTPIAPTWIPAAELEAGMQIRMDGIRRVYEAAIDGETMRFWIEGFNTPFTVPATWTYAAYIAPATCVA